VTRVVPERSMPREASSYPPHPERVPAGAIEQGRYRARFATTEAELDAILRLRFSVFNLELGEGLAASFLTGRDEDRFDRTCHHLLVEEVRDEATVVGTYRMQTSEMAAAGSGFYSAGEFDLSALPEEVRRGAVEVGRACISRQHRNRQILFLLWKGLARYMVTNRKRYLFGCCSLTSQDGCEGLKALAHLEAAGQIHPAIHVPPQPGFECSCDGPLLASPGPYELPLLFRTYLRYGAQVCGAPAIDREFRTIDFLVLFDIESLDDRTRNLFFE
jgi:putative hemolysin